MAKKTRARQGQTGQDEAPDFEKSLSELEQLVERLEQGDTTLEESLQHFERGIGLARACQQALKAAEQKVQVLLEQNGQPEIQPFEAQDEGED